MPNIYILVQRGAYISRLSFTGTYAVVAESVGEAASCFSGCAHIDKVEYIRKIIPVKMLSERGRLKYMTLILNPGIVYGENGLTWSPAERKALHE